MAAERLLRKAEIEGRLRGSNWRREREEIVREVALKDFRAAIALVWKVAEAAEEANHHPDILIHGYRKVRLSLTNHAAGGLTETDFEMAAVFDRLIAHASGA